MQAEFKLDPTGYYEKNLGSDWRERCVDAVGVLPEFAFGPHPTIAENMEKNYQFFMNWTGVQNGEHVENECFCFPGDPPQYPALRISAIGGDEVIYVYPHCIVAVVTEGDLIKWTRMD
jgi:hypothetical protein